MHPTDPRSSPTLPEPDASVVLVAGSWDADGRCRSAHDGVQFRVAGAIPGERLRVRISGRSRGAPVVWADVEEVLEPAPDGPSRRVPPCPIHGRCGACGLQHAREEGRLRSRVRSGLASLPVDLAETLAPEADWIRSPAAFGYRHKAILLPSWDAGEATLQLGGFARGTHDVVDLSDCGVLAPCLVEAERTLRAALRPALARGSLVATPPGAPLPRRVPGVRAVVLRANRAGQVLATFVATGRKPARALRPLAAPLTKGAGPIVGTFVQEHDGSGDAVTSRRRPRLLAGVRTLTEHVDGRPLTLTPLGFFQVNPDVLEQLALRAAHLATAEPVLSVVDLYCGGGVLGLTIARRGGCRLLGIDVGAESIESAGRDATEWGVDAMFLTGTPATALTDGAVTDGFRGSGPSMGRRVLVLDPPRSGCRPEDLAAGLALRPDLVMYMSCSESSLGRDAGALTAGGWTPRTLVPADMLPQTPHLEWLAVWERGA